MHQQYQSSDYLSISTALNVAATSASSTVVITFEQDTYTAMCSLRAMLVCTGAHRKAHCRGQKSKTGMSRCHPFNYGFAAWLCHLTLFCPPSGSAQRISEVSFGSSTSAISHSFQSTFFSLQATDVSLCTRVTCVEKSSWKSQHTVRAEPSEYARKLNTQTEELRTSSLVSFHKQNQIIKKPSKSWGKLEGKTLKYNFLKFFLKKIFKPFHTCYLMQLL